MEVCQGRCPSPREACLQPHPHTAPTHLSVWQPLSSAGATPSTPGRQRRSARVPRVSICCKSPRPGKKTQPGLLDPLASWDHVAPMLLIFFLSLIVLPHMNHYCCITAFISQWKNMKVWVTQSCLTLGNPCSVAHQAPLSLEFSR